MQEELSALLEKDGIQRWMLGTAKLGSLPALFWFPSGEGSFPDVGSQGPQLLSLSPDIQNADGPQGEAGHQCWGLVCYH